MLLALYFPVWISILLKCYVGRQGFINIYMFPTVSVPACVNEYISLAGVSVLRQTRWISPSLSVAPLVEIEMETFSTKTSWDIIDQDTV